MLSGMPEEKRKDTVALARRSTKRLRWVPNPGPQRVAYYSEADELFYGGQAGPGKTDLGLGLAANEHKRALFLREFNEDARDAADRFLEIVGTRDGYNGTYHIFREEGLYVRFGGCPNENDKQRYKGKPHDLYVFDEIGDFTETQYRFITTWNRSADENQRCRVVCTGNPPTRAKGLWVIKRWGPWLDPKNDLYPTEEGELLWFTTDEDGNEIYVDGPGPHDIGGRLETARSRTFIRGELKDNPDLERTDYAATLSALPKDLRDAYRDGRFDASMKDGAFQLIPTQWVLDAQARWTDQPLGGVPMCAISVDPAQGGDDNNVIAKRYDGWYAPLIKIPGKETPVGSDCAGRIVAERKDDCVVIVDCGGGYGASTVSHLTENGIEVKIHKGAEASSARSKDKAAFKFSKPALKRCCVASICDKRASIADCRCEVRCDHAPTFFEYSSDALSD